MWGMRPKKHTTSCGSGNSLFTGRGGEGILGALTREGRVVLSLFPRPSFIALNVYPPPQHLVLTSMLHEVVGGTVPPDRIGAMQDREYGVPRTRLLGT